MAELSKKTLEDFNTVTAKLYRDQAVWFLNAFWVEFSDSKKAKSGEDKFAKGPDAVWKFWEAFIEIDKTQWEEVNKKIWKQGWKEGNSLDEFFSHKYLERLDKTMTAITFRNEFRKIDVNFDKRMAMVEFLLFEYKQEVNTLMSRPQGSNQEELAAAKKKLDEVQAALLEMNRQLEAQTEAVQQLQKAQAELDAAVADLHKQEEDYKRQVDTLEAKAHDAHAGAVSKNKAANELAQLKEKDPLPLRKAKITQEAALRRVTQEKKVAEEAKEKVAKSVEDLTHKCEEAAKVLDDLQKKSGGGQGSIYWMKKELEEAQKWLPSSKKLFN